MPENHDFVIVVFAVIDTNVIVSSMLGNKNSSTKELIRYISSGNIITLYDERMIAEYEDVLGRFFTDDIVGEKINSIINGGYLVTDITQTEEFFLDKTDIPFFEVKESAKELDPYLITGNARHYPENTTRTAAFVVDIMKYLNGFVIKDKERYLEDIKKAVDGLDKKKYIKGRSTNI